MKIWLLSIGLTLLFSCNNNDKNKENSINKIQQPKTIKMDIQYAYTILYVPDVRKTMEFYKKAFGFEQKFLTPENDYGEIISGTTTISFANIELGKSNFKKGFTKSKLSDKPFGIELAFTTSEVEKVMESAIKSGALLLEETVTKPWGQKVGYLRDINGFIIEICTPIQIAE
jgi:uncharacterized glyoxalase superfamily protein PhnB